VTETSSRLKLGTRGSALARWQADHVTERLKTLHPDLAVEIVIITTTGDQVIDRPLSAIGGTGVFTKEFERALVDEEIDLAVHSLKDMPTLLPEGLALGAVLEREDPRDALISATGATLTELPDGATLGTGSQRREAQIRQVRPDLNIVDLRGNVPTRLGRLDEGNCDAIILASAGLSRLGLADRITERLSTDVMLPAAGQGAIGLEIRDQDGIGELLTGIEHDDTRAAVDAERAFLAETGGGCRVPVGVLGTIRGGFVILQAMIAPPGGGEAIRDGMNGPVADAETVGRSLAQRMLSNGGRDILNSIPAG
jgi:hydroxymethylbilane synthase